MISKFITLVLAVALATGMLVSVVAMAEEPIAITGFKRDTVGFFGSDKTLIQRIPVAEAGALKGTKVRYNSESGYYELSINDQTVFLSSRDIETSLKVGKSGASICGTVATAQHRDGSSGLGAVCK